MSESVFLQEFEKWILEKKLPRAGKKTTPKKTT